jgi:hypothetical protein
MAVVALAREWFPSVTIHAARMRKDGGNLVKKGRRAVGGHCERVGIPSIVKRGRKHNARCNCRDAGDYDLAAHGR